MIILANVQKKIIFILNPRRYVGHEISLAEIISPIGTAEILIKIARPLSTTRIT